MPSTPVSPTVRPTGPGALDLLEEAVHLLRRAPAGILACYYGATLPFVLGLLFFWADLSRDPDAESIAPFAALGLVALFLIMKTGQAVFAARLRAGLLGTGAERPWTPGRLWRLFRVQATLQPGGLILLPLAAVALLPAAWVFAFFQHLTTAGDEANGSVRAALGHAGRLARPWARQNHTALGVLSLLAVIVWVDGLVGVLLLPQLVRMFTGTESVFSRSGANLLLNTTFLMTSFAVAYVALDPLVKSFYVLRGFYADARRTGEDLRRELRALPPVPAAVAGSIKPAPATSAPATALAALLWLTTLLAPVTGVNAQSSAPAAAPAPNPSAAPALDRSIEEVIRRREFAWRLPRGEQRRRIVNAGKKPDSAFVRWWKRVSERIDRFMRWVRRLFERDKKDANDEPVRATVPRDWLRDVLQPAAWILMGLGLAAGVVFYLRARRMRQADPAVGAAAPAVIGPDPDAAELADEALLPTRLPEDEWLRLGRELRAKGETRLALRAFYLSVLSGLAARELVAVARHKSNGDYLAEVRRRGRDRAGLPEGFGTVVGLFERPWYGRHPADEPTLDALLAGREEVLANAGGAAPPPPTPG